MGWTATGRFVDDTPQRLRLQDDSGIAPISGQQQSLTGLLGGVRTTSGGSGPTATTTPTPTPTNGGSILVNDNGMGPAVKPATGTTTPPATGGGTTPATGGGTTTTPSTTPTTTPLPQPQPPTFQNPPPVVVPNGPSSTPPPSTYVLPDKPTAEDDSVVTRLNGLLDSNSPYMQAARMAGIRQANSRGLLNSSIAAGASEASAIAAAAPIASQEAAQVAQRNQTNLEAWNNLRNATTLQHLQDDAAWQRQAAQLTNALQLQGMSDQNAMLRLIQQGNIQAAIQQMQDSNALTQTQINANVSLIGNYLNAFSALAQNENIPASARDAYMAEYLRVSQQGMGLVNALSGVTVTWPGGAAGPGTPVSGGEFYHGPSKSEIMGMQHDGQKGNFAAAAAVWNQFHPNDLIPIPGQSGGSNPANALFGVAGLLAKPFG